MDTSSRQKQTSRRTTPVEDAEAVASQPSQDSPAETMCIRSGPMRISTGPQTSFSANDLPATLSPNLPLDTSHSPTQYTKMELPIHSGVSPAQAAMQVASMSAQDLKRKRTCVETGVPPTTGPNPLEYCAPVYMNAQPFMPESYHEIQGFQPQANPTSGQPQHPSESFGEEMDSSGFPYYFQY